MPTAIPYLSITLLTTLIAPITTPSLIFDPLIIFAPEATHTSLPIKIPSSSNSSG
jgi:hypothetical protein